jgi:RNA polymerase-binding transcription factor
MPIQKKDIPQFKAALLSKRAALVGDSNHLEEEAVRKGKDDAATLDISNFADLGSDTYEQEFDLTMLENQGETLRAVDEALKRIEDGNFGVCDMCKKPMKKGRLQAMPHARFCVSCQNEKEQGGGY